MKKFYTVYEIKNKINDKKYIGCHMTDNLDDGYMGSGIYLKRAMRKYGIENFNKVILYFCDNEKEMLEKESELVTEDIIESGEYYNLTLGGGGNWSHINNNLHKFRHHFENKVIVNDENGNRIKIDKNDDRWLNGELESWNKNKVTCKDKDGNFYLVDNNDYRYINGELIPTNRGLTLVIDKDGKVIMIDKDDDRIGEDYKLFWEGRKHKEETKRKIGEKNSIHQRGDGNSQYGTCWVHNLELKESKKIKKEEINKWIKKGWIKGRKMKF